MVCLPFSAYFPLKKAGENQAFRKKSAFGPEKSKRKWKDPQEHLKVALSSRCGILF